MAGKKPDFRVMTSRPKRNGDGNIYTTIGAGWQFHKDGTTGISIELDALPLSNKIVLFPITENDASDELANEF